MSGPQFTELTYRSDEFGHATEVHINGQLVEAVHRLQVDHREGEFSEVALVLRGVRVTAEPRT